MNCCKEKIEESQWEKFQYTAKVLFWKSECNWVGKRTEDLNLLRLTWPSLRWITIYVVWYDTNAEYGRDISNADVLRISQNIAFFCLKHSIIQKPVYYNFLHEPESSSWSKIPKILNHLRRTGHWFNNLVLWLTKLISKITIPTCWDITNFLLYKKDK